MNRWKNLMFVYLQIGNSIFKQVKYLFAKSDSSTLFLSKRDLLTHFTFYYITSTISLFDYI